MIRYQVGLNGIDCDQLSGFFVGWRNPPSAKKFLKLLEGSYRVVLALDNDQVVGFINAISDGTLAAYIPLFEVLPKYQRRGIGGKLISKMKNELRHLYMIDLLCDKNLVSYYEKQGMKKATGALIRNYENQSGYG